MNITSKDTEIICLARKSLLFDQKNTWMKKQSDLFNFTMGTYDSAEACELVGTCMLSFIWKKYNKKDFGLYRDDGLEVVKRIKVDRKQKK